jgi:uncharacterized protein (TIGR03435 family)
LHKENRTAVIYEMTVAKSGHKMSVVPAAEPPAPSPNGAAPPAATVGGLTFRSSEDRIELLGQRATMRQLIVWATEQSDRPIIDRTGLTGNYDFAMPWEPQGVRVAEETGVTAPADVASINSALERYLGLLLVPRKEPVEMLVIDRLERVPTEN